MTFEGTPQKGRFFVWTVAKILGFALVGSLAANAQETRHPQVAHDAVRALVGNTLVYTKSGSETGVFIHLDGTGQAVTRGPDRAGEPRPIQWANLSDGKFCVTDVGRKPWDGDCGILSVDGANATLTPTSGPAWPGRVLEGDAWKLDPATRSDERFIGKQAVQMLVGNTLVFIPQGGGREYRALYFTANGTTRRAHNDQPDFDHWVLQPDEKWSIRGEDEQLCLSGGAWREDYCTALSVVGDLVTLRDRRIGPLHAKLLKGDARSLSSSAEAATKGIADALAGNTVLLKAADRQAETDSVMYFLRDGSGRAKWGGRPPTAIKWLLQLDGKLCVVEQQAEFRNDRCATLSIDGNALMLTTPSRSDIPGRILKGNALKM